MAKLQTSSGKQVPVPVTVLAVIGLVAFMAWWGIRSFGPEPEILTPAGQAQNNWLRKIAIECKGDFSKLSPADQLKLQTNTMGHGVSAMKSEYEKSK